MADLTGIILAGGKSSRFKSPKYLAKLGGLTLLEIAINKLKPLCSQIIVVSKEPIERREARGESKVVNIIEKSPQYHPLVGIIEGLKSSKTSENLVIATDMPFICLKLIEGLLSCKADVCIYRHHNRAEPLFGLYHKNCLPKITSLLDGQRSTLNGQRLCIIDALAKCKIEYIEIAKGSLDFFNINTKEDLIEAQKIVKNNPELIG